MKHPAWRPENPPNRPQSRIPRENDAKYTGGGPWGRPNTGLYFFQVSHGRGFECSMFELLSMLCKWQNVFREAGRDSNSKLN
eukprot:15430204-Alexandrium_andersonii.AAC.1